MEWKGSLLVTGDKAGVMGIWDLNKSQLIKALRCHKGAVSSVKFHQKQGLIFTTGLNVLIGFYVGWLFNFDRHAIKQTGL